MKAVALLSAFGPYLEAFANLETLHLANFKLAAHHPQNQPEPSFQLTSQSLSVTPGFGFRPLEPSDLVWFTHSSRLSLRHLSLEGHSSDALAEVAEWGASLRTLGLGLRPREANEQLGVLAELARMKELEQLKLRDGWSDGSGVRAVAAEVNRRVGREVAVAE